MTGPGIPTAYTASVDRPQKVLEEGLLTFLDRQVSIVTMDSQPLESQSTYPIDRLRLTLDSGERLSVIFKRLGSGPSTKGGRREVLIYRRLLSGQRFGAPALYASVYDEAKGRYWLFLEDVGEEQVLGGDTHDWLPAVRWLAEMHGTYHSCEAELRALHCLGEWGPEFYQRLASDARQSLELAGTRGQRVRFDRLMDRYESAVEYLVRQPRTLVHGDIFRHNLIVQPGPRIRALDWEGAAVGLGAYDLVRLLDGWGSDKPAFIAVYVEEFNRRAALPVDLPTFYRVLTLCSILNVLCHFGWDVEACKDPSHVNGLLSELATIWQCLDGGKSYF